MQLIPGTPKFSNKVAFQATGLADVITMQLEPSLRTLQDTLIETGDFLVLPEPTITNGDILKQQMLDLANTTKDLQIPAPDFKPAEQAFGNFANLWDSQGRRSLPISPGE